MLLPSIFGENLLDDFFDVPSFRIPADKRTDPTLMKTDIKEKENGYEIAMDLPGFKKEDVQAELKEGYLTVSASTSSDNEEKDKDGKFLRRERFYGSCSRSFYVGKELTQEDIKAKFDNGVLRIDVPKKEALPKQEEKKLISIEG